MRPDYRLRFAHRDLDGAQQNGQEAQYNSIENIVFKSEMLWGSYSYLNAGPHAVTQAGSHTYTYDANGNMKNDSRGRIFTYSVFDKVTRVEKDGDRSTDFYYGPERKRYKRVDTHDGDSTTTLYSAMWKSVQRRWHA